jgi:hypothetical protein
MNVDEDAKLKKEEERVAEATKAEKKEKFEEAKARAEKEV